MSKKKIFALFIAANFLIISCSSSGSSKKKTVAAQRAVETREYAVDTKSLMQSSIGTFQDLGFTIDTISEEFGLITASKVEKPKKKKKSDAEKALQALALVAVIWWAFNSDSDNDRGSSGGGGKETTVVKDYKLTATLTVKAISESEPLSSLRVNFGGGKRERSMEFFKEFFTAVDKSLFLDDNLEQAKVIDLETDN
ncbi:MAG: hypothetical protein ACJ0RO_01825 [Candidatus Neomarinimicrobiota bacterium]|tara:strand:- start:49 stop:639 length:591 start_codon:yes stop_codon:yes gene_type:complete